MRILFTPTGRRQFLEAIAYIHRDKPSAAVTFRQKAEKSLSRLKKFPESGRPLPEFPELPFREVIVNPPLPGLEWVPQYVVVNAFQG